MVMVDVLVVLVAGSLDAELLPDLPARIAPAAAAPPASTAIATHFIGPCQKEGELFVALAVASPFFGAAIY
jgi:hypothetical protein